MKIVGGMFRGRTLASPADDSIRPTSDRVREAVFNILMHGVPDFELAKVHVLDLFAGTGALGLEAISRGAKSALFVEEIPEARALIRENIEAFGLTGVTRIYRRDATSLGDAGQREAFGLVFLDPPYGRQLGPAALISAAMGGWLAPGAVAVLEERRGTTIVWPPGTPGWQHFALLDERTWGDTQASFMRYIGSHERHGST